MKSPSEYLPAPTSRKLTLRTPDEILAMQFDDSDRLLGDRLMAKGQPFTMLAAGGAGKSRLLLQLIVCMLTGRKFLNFETYGAGLKWLVLQTENSNRRLQDDLQKLKQWIGDDWHLVQANLVLHTLETDEDGLVYLADVLNQTAVAEAIESTKPDVVAFDPLGDFGIGNPDKDEDMRETTRTISRLCKKENPERAIVVLHHAITGRSGAAKAIGFDRASFGRNSKVLQAWTRGQMNITPVDPDSNERLVIACGKCSNGKEFVTFAVALNPATMIYEVDQNFDIEVWQADITGKPTGPLMNPDRVRQLCGKGMDKADLAKAIVKDCGCSRATAYRQIATAESAKKITKSKAHVGDDYYIQK